MDQFRLFCFRGFYNNSLIQIDGLPHWNVQEVLDSDSGVLSQKRY